MVFLHLRLTLVAEVVLCGFELDLYAQNERLFQYWYATRLLDIQHETLSSLLALIVEDADCAGEAKPVSLTRSYANDKLLRQYSPAVPLKSASSNFGFARLVSRNFQSKHIIFEASRRPDGGSRYEAPQ